MAWCGRAPHTDGTGDGPRQYTRLERVSTEVRTASFPIRNERNKPGILGVVEWGKWCAGYHSPVREYYSAGVRAAIDLSIPVLGMSVASYLVLC